MKRRDVLRMAPLAAAGAAAGGTIRDLLWPGPEDAPMTGRVRGHRGRGQTAQRQPGPLPRRPARFRRDQLGLRSGAGQMGFRGPGAQERRGRDPHLRLRRRQGHRVGRPRAGTPRGFRSHDRRGPVPARPRGRSGGPLPSARLSRARPRRLVGAGPPRRVRGPLGRTPQRHVVRVAGLARRGQGVPAGLYRPFPEDRALRPGHRLPGRGRPYRRMGQGRVVDVRPLRRLQRAHAPLFPGLAENALPGRGRPRSGRPGGTIRP